MKHVIEHFDAPNGSFFTSPMCSTCQVEQLYEEMSFAPRNANQAYMDAWTLKRLFGFSIRRQKDAAKRGQQPRATSQHMLVHSPRHGNDSRCMPAFSQSASMLTS